MQIKTTKLKQKARPNIISHPPTQPNWDWHNVNYHLNNSWVIYKRLFDMSAKIRWALEGQNDGILSRGNSARVQQETLAQQTKRTEMEDDT